MEALIEQGRTRVVFTANHTCKDPLTTGTSPISQRAANFFVFFQSFRLALFAFAPFSGGTDGLEFGATNKLVHMIVEATLNGKILLAKLAFQLLRRGAG